ncbi:serine hydrolase domain-containing protein [Paenibacillus azoreducens]|uniref:serine hydrolase domain-containing protein n=1 Tax=Paenibacillus azoreducens TaxID=116718 RepID=UPI0039F5024C
MQQTERSLPRKNTEALGISSQKVIEFLDHLKAHQIEMHSFMLLRHGQVAADGWWAPYGPELPHMLFSLSKSFTSTAIGMALHEGILTLDDTVISFFPEDLPVEVPDHLAAMQIRHLLMMGTGHDKDTTDALHEAEDGNWVKAFLQLPVPHEPGTHFLYNTGATYMLSAILQKASGQRLLDYLKPRLFEPLGIEGPTWETCPRGINTGGYGLSIKTEDIAKFGQLYLQKGVWHGVRLIEEEWIQEATNKQISNGDGGDSDWSQGYGYQFWRCRHGVYRGDGAFGQFCIVMPEQDAVIAITAGTGDMQGILNDVWDHLLDAFLPEPIEVDEYSAELDERLAKLHLDMPKFEPASELETQINGKSYELEQNQYSLQGMRLQFDRESACLMLKRNTEEKITLGRHSWITGPSHMFGGKESLLASSFTWKSQDELVLTICGIETPFCITMEIQFKGDTIVINDRFNVSFGMPEAVIIRGKASE